MRRLQQILQNAIPRFRHRVHHAVGTDRDNAIDLVKRDRQRAELTGAIGRDRFDDIGDNGSILRPGRLEAWGFV
jgi:hypothetical protein